MSALALVASRRGVAVTGCDTHPNGAQALARAGVTISGTHDPVHVSGVRAVVYTAAVPAEHEELEAARVAGVPVIRRADALGQLVSGGTLVAVAGTHGKTTTTAMLTEALVACGRDPTGLVGGRVALWGGNARVGGENLFVAEADEYDRAFLALAPTVALVTNIEADHLECYGSVDELESAFSEFAGRAERALVGADDAGARRLLGTLSQPGWSVGTRSDADVRLERVKRDRRRSRAEVRLPDGRRVGFVLQVPGMHNLRNGAMALAAVASLGEDVERAARGLARFSGVSRRFEVVGAEGDVVVVDDYAHHPTEVAATIGAARQRFPRARLVAVFQPHLYSRTQRHGSALGIALSAADRVVVTDVYAARERPIAGVTGKKVANAARRAGAEVDWVEKRGELAMHVAGVARAGDVILLLGAGDITETGPELLARLREMVGGVW